MAGPNVLYLNSHDTGRYVSPHGHAVHTPRMAAFAREGVLFRDAHCNAPTCSPSRASLLTGQWAHVNGMLGLCHRGFRLVDHRRHLAHALRGHGYRTTLCGIQHCLTKDEVDDLYDEVVPATGGAERAANVAQWLRDRPADAGPFYLELGFGETHRTRGDAIQWHNGDASPLGDADHSVVPPTLPDTPDTRRDFADYAEAVARLDSYYGQVLDALADAGHADNTLVVLTTDHGIAFPRMKCSLTSHGTGVLLMLRGPAGSPLRGGKVVDAAVQHLDLVPTILEATGLPAPSHDLHGTSLLPLADGRLDAARKDALHDELFAEVTYHAAYEPKRSVRTGRWLYERRFDDATTTPVLPNCDPSPSKDTLLAAGWAETELPRETLIDLALDPAEANNLAGDLAHAATLEAMRGRLDRWMRETGDPLLSGPVPVPPGATVNPRRGRHATQEPVAFPDGGAAP